MSELNPALSALVKKVGRLDEAAEAIAAERQNQLAKPTGSLGRLESLSIQLAGITGETFPALDPALVLVFAADHGVAWSRGISAYPPQVTAHMVMNYAAGGAVFCVLARQANARRQRPPTSARDKATRPRPLDRGWAANGRGQKSGRL